MVESNSGKESDSTEALQRKERDEDRDVSEQPIMAPKRGHVF